MNYAEDLINEPTEICRICNRRVYRDEITNDNICIDCLDEKDYLAEMQMKRVLEDY